MIANNLSSSSSSSSSSSKNTNNNNTLHYRTTSTSCPGCLRAGSQRPAQAAGQQRPADESGREGLPHQENAQAQEDEDLQVKPNQSSHIRFIYHILTLYLIYMCYIILINIYICDR